MRTILPGDGCVDTLVVACELVAEPDLNADDLGPRQRAAHFVQDRSRRLPSLHAWRCERRRDELRLGAVKVPPALKVSDELHKAELATRRRRHHPLLEPTHLGLVKGI